MDRRDGDNLPPHAPDSTDVLFYVLRRKRRLARAAMLFERVWPALWPPFGAACLFLIVALLDVPAMLPPWARIGLAGLFAVIVPVLLVLGLRRVAAPAVDAADRRLERATGLSHRPLEALQDRPAVGEGGALWLAHIARARAAILRLRVGPPRPGLAAIDRRALRIGTLLALVAAVVVAGEQAPARLLRAVSPGVAPPPVPAQTLLQAWITPPSYTGLAPIFLKPEGGSVTVPAGSHLTANLSGGEAAPEMQSAAGPLPFAVLGPGSWQLDRDLNEGGRLIIRRAGRDVAAWDIAVIANVAPEVRFPDTPTATGAARAPQLRIPWEVRHAYGVTGLQAELRLKDRPEAPPLILAIPLPGGAPKQARGARAQDLTPHPWAGLPIVGVLTAREATGLIGTSHEEFFNLPERRFDNPVARALIAVRKGLSLRPDERQQAAGHLQGLTALDDVWKDDLVGYLNLQAIIGLLRHNAADAAVDEAQARLWELALRLEEGAAERTARALEQARQALREALEAEKRGEQTDRAEIEKRTKEVEEALKKHLEALAEQARRDPGGERFDPERQRQDARDLQRLAQEMKEAAERGDMDQAREKLAEMEKLLDELEKGQNQQARKSERQKQRAEQRQKGEQQMSAVQDMVRRQGGLLDHAQTRDENERPAYDPRRAFQRPGFAQPPANDPQRPSPERQADERKGDQRIQQALRRALGELMQQHGDLTGNVPPNLGEADSAMRDAARAMEEGRDQAAAQSSRQAIAALQKGSQQMGQQLSRMFGQSGEDGDDDDGDGDGQEGQDGQQGDGRDGNQQGNRDGNGMGNQPGGRNWGQGRPDRPWGGRRGVDRRDDRRDPLGRQLKEGNGGLDESGLTQVPEEMEQARTRAIQEELRRRGGERSRPKPELDYIERLLRQF